MTGATGLWVGGVAFAVNLAVMIWSAARAQAKGEATIKTLIATEREKRAEQFYEAREFARSQAQAAAEKADAASAKITDVEVRMLQAFTNYPTKADMRELFSEKLHPVEERLSVVYDALVQRGLQTPTRTYPSPVGDRP